MCKGVDRSTRDGVKVDEVCKCDDAKVERWGCAQERIFFASILQKPFLLSKSPSRTSMSARQTK